MTAEEYATLPDEILVRELRYEVATPGYRVRRLTLATTLLDAAMHPATELAEVYYKRWRVEHDFRHLKITMNMDVLKCMTVDGVLKELAMYAIAYNLVCSAMLESARTQRVDPDRLSLIDGLRWLTGMPGDGDTPMLVVNPCRHGRYEPRVKKRRPKQYMRMTKPRRDYHEDLIQQWFAAYFGILVSSNLDSRGSRLGTEKTATSTLEPEGRKCGDRQAKFEELIDRLRHRPRLVRSFFAQAGLLLG